MADTTSTATVDIIVNGKSAQKELEELEAKATKAANAAAKFNRLGEEAYAEYHENIHKKALADLDKLKGTYESVQYTIDHLDKASLKELKKTLAQLRKEFAKMKPGTDMWNQQAERIRTVRARIDSINQTLRVQQQETQTLWQKFKDWQTAGVAAVGAIMGKLSQLISFYREAADAFASMEQEMANVRKYTGMSEEQVNSLNESFKQIDTRTAREELNKYAQEAGRLGKQSEADVLGYVGALLFSKSDNIL